MYRCTKNTPHILLLSKNNIDFSPIDFDFSEPNLVKTKEKILEEFALEECDFYKDRLIGSYNKLSFEKSKKVVQLFVGVARIKKYVDISSKSHPFIKWVKKEDVLKELKTKEHIRSFKRVFGEDDFWECLDTEK